ncbi:MAG: peptidoglycan editing factor PgeF [Gammaproteobacteria bacterium]
MIETIQPNWSAPSTIRACCTTRLGGVSAEPFDSLNLALHVGDDPARVAQNRKLLREQLNLPAEPCWINQTHGTQTVTLEQDVSRDADAAVTRLAGTIAVVMTADCLPILLCNRAGSEVGAVHAGWRGLQAGVIESALATMNSPNHQLMAWIGPGISQACFEVGDDVRTAFIDSMPHAQPFFSANRRGHWLCDLAGLAEQVLKAQGVDEVCRDAHCSYRDSGRFYSYRRNANTGRMATLIWIN